MADDLRQGLDVLKMLQKIIGLEENIKINSGIYEHIIGSGWEGVDELFNVKDDIYIIEGSKDKPIVIDDIINVFDKIQKQFKKISKSEFDGRCYFYEGIEYNSKKNTYEIYWGS